MRFITMRYNEMVRYGEKQNQPRSNQDQLNENQSLALIALALFWYFGTFHTIPEIQCQNIHTCKMDDTKWVVFV